uniref:Uncharacterized protein n=1 Tax=Neospora caninum (strain Liverpool) TaxID=572307 RepID=A0A0F7UAG4_NEOCL|nr:TPA: hypothetical protein BN1204_026660 [Neospora caninum Liverpool]
MESVEARSGSGSGEDEGAFASPALKPLESGRSRSLSSSSASSRSSASPSSVSSRSSCVSRGSSRETSPTDAQAPVPDVHPHARGESRLDKPFSLELPDASSPSVSIFSSASAPHKATGRGRRSQARSRRGSDDFCSPLLSSLSGSSHSVPSSFSLGSPQQQYEGAAARYRLLQLIEEFYGFQQTLESLKQFYLLRTRALEERLAAEVEARQASDLRAVFASDRTSFLQEQLARVTEKLQGDIQRRDELVQILELNLQHLQEQLGLRERQIHALGRVDAQQREQIAQLLQQVERAEKARRSGEAETGEAAEAGGRNNCRPRGTEDPKKEPENEEAARGDGEAKADEEEEKQKKEEKQEKEEEGGEGAKVRLQDRRPSREDMNFASALSGAPSFASALSSLALLPGFASYPFPVISSKEASSPSSPTCSSGGSGPALPSPSGERAGERSGEPDGLTSRPVSPHSRDRPAASALSPTSSAAVLALRERQLERVAGQLDSLNMLCMKQGEELQKALTDLERERRRREAAQREANRERRRREEAVAQIRQSEKSLQYRATLSSSSVPVLIPLPSASSGSAASPLGSSSGALITQLRLPPQEFFADLKAEVDELLALMRMQNLALVSGKRGSFAPGDSADAQSALATSPAEDGHGIDSRRNSRETSRGDRLGREAQGAICASWRAPARPGPRSVSAEEVADAERKRGDGGEEETWEAGSQGVRTPHRRSAGHVERSSEGERRNSADERSGERQKGEVSLGAHGRRGASEDDETEVTSAERSPSRGTSADLQDGEPNEEVDKTAVNSNAHTSAGRSERPGGRSRSGSTPSGPASSALSLVQHARDSVMKAFFPLQASLASLDCEHENATPQVPKRENATHADLRGQQPQALSLPLHGHSPEQRPRRGDGTGEEKREGWREKKREGREDAKTEEEREATALRAASRRECIEASLGSSVRARGSACEARMHTAKARKDLPVILEDSTKRDQNLFGPESAQATLARLSEHDDCGASASSGALGAFLLSAAVVTDGHPWWAASSASLPASRVALAETAPASRCVDRQPAVRSVDWREQCVREGHLTETQRQQSQWGELEPLWFVRGRRREDAASSVTSSVFRLDRDGIEACPAPCADATSTASTATVDSAFAFSGPSSPPRVSASGASPASSPSLTQCSLLSCDPASSLVEFPHEKLGHSLRETRRPSQPLCASVDACTVHLSRVLCGVSSPARAAGPEGGASFSPSVHFVSHFSSHDSRALVASSFLDGTAFPSVSPSVSALASAFLHQTRGTPRTGCPPRWAGSQRRQSHWGERAASPRSETSGDASRRFRSHRLADARRSTAESDGRADCVQSGQDAVFSCSPGVSRSVKPDPGSPRIPSLSEKSLVRRGKVSLPFTQWEASGGDLTVRTDSNVASVPSLAPGCVTNERGKTGVLCESRPYHFVSRPNHSMRTRPCQLSLRGPAGAFSECGSEESRERGTAANGHIAGFCSTAVRGHGMGWSPASALSAGNFILRVSPVNLGPAGGAPVQDGACGSTQCSEPCRKRGLERAYLGHCSPACCAPTMQTLRTGGQLAPALQSPAPLSPLSGGGVSGGGTPRQAWDWNWRPFWLFSSGGAGYEREAFEVLDNFAEDILDGLAVPDIEEGAEEAGD